MIVTHHPLLPLEFPFGIHWGIGKANHMVVCFALLPYILPITHVFGEKDANNICKNNEDKICRRQIDRFRDG